MVQAPASEAECRALLNWAHNTPVAAPKPATQDELARHMQFMQATLPAKAVSDETGAMRATVYASLLSGYSNDAIKHMVRRACQTLDWFPTPKQCLALLADYRAPEPPQSVALRLCHDFAAESFDRWIENIEQGQPIGDVPEQWKRVAVERGLLRHIGDGEYITRAEYRELNPPAAEPEASETEQREAA